MNIELKINSVIKKYILPQKIIINSMYMVLKKGYWIYNFIRQTQK